MNTATLYVGDALDTLRDLPDEQFQTCITSPPYWGLRDYGENGQLGLEETPQEYVQNLVNVFREVRRTLRDGGTLWLNLGDSYAQGGTMQTGRNDAGEQGTNYARSGRSESGPKTRVDVDHGLKQKDLSLIPYRVASALQADGWWLRSDIIWKKPNPMPESVTDRPTSSHEHIFLLSPSKTYFYDADAIREDSTSDAPVFNGGHDVGDDRNDNGRSDATPNASRNKRDVWEVTTKPYPDAHFAVYPPELIEPCVKAGTSKKGECPACGAPWERVTERKEKDFDGSKYGERAVEATGGAIDGGTKNSTLGSSGGAKTADYETKGWQPTCDCDAGDPEPQTVLDPFGGAMTTPMTAMKLRRDAVAIDLSAEYVEMGAERIRKDAPLMNHVEIVEHTGA